MMIYKHNDNIMSLTEAGKMVQELNKLAPLDNTATYLKGFLECVRKGAIKEITINGTTYEIYTDIIETEE